MEAVQLFEKNEPDRAIALINKHLPQASDEDKVSIVNIYVEWGFLDEAISILIALTNKYPHESESRVMHADLYIEINKDEEAMLLLNEITAEDDVYLQALVQLADLYQAQGLFEVAEQKLLTAKQIEPTEEIIDF